MKKQSEVCLQKRPTPLQDIILQTAENHLSRCEQIFGISRYYFAGHADRQAARLVRYDY